MNSSDTLITHDIVNIQKPLSTTADSVANLLSRLVVVSNRLPVSFDDDGDGKVCAKVSSGGLVTALTPVLRETYGLWIGYGGTTRPQNMEALLEDAGRRIGCMFKGVPIPASKFEGYYAGFSNRTIWPLFHGFTDRSVYSPSYWQAYQEVNALFAKTVSQYSEPGDFIWVHDYHLMLVAREMERLDTERRTGFFLHIPFPPPELLNQLPNHIALMDALTRFDLLGFQTRSDRENFIRCVKLFNAATRVRENGRTVEIVGRNLRMIAGHFPISIDTDEFAYLASDGQVAEKAAQIKKKYKDLKIVLSVDRLDYSKGIVARLNAFRYLLKHYPDLRGKVVLIQVLVPSREDIPEYREEKEKLERIISDTNTAFESDDYKPIEYIYRNMDRSELVAYYRSGDIALITPLKDGMNLVAKEYCISTGDGVLILSSHAGAARQLFRDALIVNPRKKSEVAAAIFQAIGMPDGERKRRMQNLREKIRKQDIYWWSNNFLSCR